MNNYQPHNILVTGGAGFIGSHYIRYALQHDPNIRIVNLDLLTYAGSLTNLAELPDTTRYHFVCGDISDRSLVDRLLREHTIDTIVHFAAESHVDRSIIGPAAFIETNIIGTFTLLEAARQYWLDEQQWSSEQCRFHHISTDEVYGSLAENEPAFTEQAALSPNSPYSASKASSDHLVHAYFKTYQLPMTISNCSNNYGPNQHPEKLIPTIIRSCVNWQPIPIYGNGKNKRDWLYVGDHCQAIDTVIRSGCIGEKYNVGGGDAEEHQNLEIAQKICAIFDDASPRISSYADLITFVTDRPGHDWRYAVNSAKITALGWRAATLLDDGLQITVNWFMNQTNKEMVYGLE